MATYTFSTTDDTLSLQGVTKTQSSTTDFPSFSTTQSTPEIGRRQPSSSEYQYYGTVITYTLPANLTLISPIKTAILSLTIVNNVTSASAMTMMIAQKKTTTSTDYDYFTLGTQAISAGTSGVSRTLSVPVTQYGLMDCGYVLYAVGAVNVRYKITEATLTINTCTPADDYYYYYLRMSRSGYSATSDVKGDYLTKYTTSYTRPRVGSTSSYATGYATIGGWNDTTNEIYNLIKKFYGPDTTYTASYILGNTDVTLNFLIHARNASGSREVSCTIGAKNNSAASAALYNDGYVKRITIEEDFYTLPISSLNLLTGSGGTTTWSQERQTRFFNYGFAFGGTVSSIGTYYIDSIVLQLKLIKKLAIPNIVSIVNDTSGLDKYCVYIVENNELVPYRPMLVNNTGTELEICQ